MIEPYNLLLFIPASLLLIIAPGPDILFLFSQSISRGPRAGVALALGLASGNLSHTVAAALGISLLLKSVPVAFFLIKSLGVIYLLYLAWSSLRPNAEAAEDRHRRIPASWFWRGFLMNNLNPKVMLFFLAFLPQFVGQTSTPVWLQMIALGGVFILLVILVFVPIGLFAGGLHHWLARIKNPALEKLTRWLVPVVLVFLAVRLVLLEV